MSLAARPRALLVLLCIGPWAACGAGNEDTPDHLDFALPTLSFQLSTADGQWRSLPAKDTQVPHFLCAGPLALPADCCALPYDCADHPFACDAATNYCALTFDVILSVPVLPDATLGYTAFAGRAFAQVALLGATATATPTGDALPIRSADLYLGPLGLSSASDAGAVWFAHVALDQAGIQALTVDQTGQDAFSALARAYDTPFSMLLLTQIVFPSGPNALPATGPLAGSVSLEVATEARGYY